ncbi:unnamed protein product [Xylocopa violacea]|uniref:Serine protease gd N-terminal domain-containing protein n=1 Tax=Xylocopa violacea TaxID=135666 RepID=A0ABP1NW45_XYLVO
MIGAVVKTALLIEVLQLTAGVFGQSPCPKYFWYNYNSKLNKMIGHVQILSPPKGIPLTLNLTLNFADPVITGEGNKIKLAESIEDTIKAINEGKPLMYEIYFSTREPLPLVTDLKLNGKVLCVGSPPIARNITRVVLTHTFNVPKLATGIDDQNNLDHRRNPEVTIGIPNQNNLDYRRNPEVTTRIPNQNNLDYRRNPEVTTGIPNQNNLGHRRNNTNRDDSLPTAGTETPKNSCNVCHRYCMYSLITILYLAHLLCSKLMLR